LKRIAWILVVAAALVAVAGCGGKDALKTEPEPAVVPAAPPPPTAPPDPRIRRAHAVLRHFGHLTRKYMSYAEYSRRKSGGTVTSVSPDWFYDTYSLDLNEDGYWAKVNFQTAERAIARDPRIEALLGNAPRNAIDMKVKTPAGRRFVLSDSEGDGVLDYAAPQQPKGSQPAGFDTELRDRMQATYSRLIAVIKEYYPRIPPDKR